VYLNVENLEVFFIAFARIMIGQRCCHCQLGLLWLPILKIPNTVPVRKYKQIAKIILTLDML